MKTLNQLVITGLVAGLAAATSLVQAEVTWLPATDNDMRSTDLVAADGVLPVSRHVDDQAISFAWAADGDSRTALDGAGGPATSAARVESRQYFVDATGEMLAAGIELPISAAGAVIRISPLSTDASLSINPRQLQLEMNGQPLDRGAISQVTGGSELSRQGMTVPEPTLAFRLNRNAGYGLLRLIASDTADQLDYVIHVFEPNSQWVAELSLPRFNFLAGEVLDFSLSLGDGTRQAGLESVQAVLATPDATRTWDLALDSLQRQLSVTAPMVARSADEGLFEAHVYVEARDGDLVIRRDLKLPLNLAPPVARFTESATRTAASGPGLDLGVETTAAGRFMINASVYGTNSRGQLEPLAYVQSAAMLQPGTGQIRLDIDPQLLADSGLGAPFEIRNLDLLDQGRMLLMERRARAVIIAD